MPIIKVQKPQDSSKTERIRQEVAQRQSQAKALQPIRQEVNRIKALEDKGYKIERTPEGQIKRIIGQETKYKTSTGYKTAPLYEEIHDNGQVKIIQKGFKEMITADARSRYGNIVEPYIRSETIMVGDKKVKSTSYTAGGLGDAPKKIGVWGYTDEGEAVQIWRPKERTKKKSIPYSETAAAQYQRAEARGMTGTQQLAREIERRLKEAKPGERVRLPGEVGSQQHLRNVDVERARQDREIKERIVRGLPTTTKGIIDAAEARRNILLSREPWSRTPEGSYVSLRGREVSIGPLPGQPSVIKEEPQKSGFERLAKDRGVDIREAKESLLLRGEEPKIQAPKPSMEEKTISQEIAMLNARINTFNSQPGFMQSESEKKKLIDEQQRTYVKLEKKGYGSEALNLLSKVGGIGIFSAAGTAGTLAVGAIANKLSGLKKSKEEKEEDKRAKIKSLTPEVPVFTTTLYIPKDKKISDIIGTFATSIPVDLGKQETITTIPMSEVGVVAPEVVEKIGVDVRMKGYGAEQNAEELAKFNKIGKEINIKKQQGKDTRAEEKQYNLARTEMVNKFKTLYPNRDSDKVIAKIGVEPESIITDKIDIVEKIVAEEPVNADVLVAKAGIYKWKDEQLKNKEEEIVKFIEENPNKTQEANIMIKELKKESDRLNKDASGLDKQIEKYNINIGASLEARETVRKLKKKEAEENAEKVHKELINKYGQMKSFVNYSPEDKIKLLDATAKVDEYQNPEIKFWNEEVKKQKEQLNKLYEKKGISWGDQASFDSIYGGPTTKLFKAERELERAKRKEQVEGIQEKNRSIAPSRVREPYKYLATVPLRVGAGLAGKAYVDPEGVALGYVGGVGLGALFKGIGVGAARWAGTSAGRNLIIKAGKIIGITGLTGLAAKEAYADVVNAPYKLEAVGELGLDAIAFGVGAGKGAQAIEGKVIKVGDIKFEYKPDPKIVETVGMPRVVALKPGAKGLAPGELPRISIGQRLGDIKLKFDKIISRFGKKYNVEVETKIKPDDSIVHTETYGNLKIVVNQKPGQSIATKQTFKGDNLIATEKVKGFNRDNVQDLNSLVTIETEPITGTWKTDEGRGLLQGWRGLNIDSFGKPIDKNWFIEGVMERQVEKTQVSKIKKSKVEESDILTRFLKEEGKGGVSTTKEFQVIPGKTYTKDIKLEIGKVKKEVPKLETVTGEPTPVFQEPIVKLGSKPGEFTMEQATITPRTQIERPDLYTTISTIERARGIIRTKEMPKIPFMERMKAKVNPLLERFGIIEDVPVTTKGRVRTPEELKLLEQFAKEKRLNFDIREKDVVIRRPTPRQLESQIGEQTVITETRARTKTPQEVMIQEPVKVSPIKSYKPTMLEVPTEILKPRVRVEGPGRGFKYLPTSVILQGRTQGEGEMLGVGLSRELKISPITKAVPITKTEQIVGPIATTIPTTAVTTVTTPMKILTPELYIQPPPTYPAYPPWVPPTIPRPPLDILKPIIPMELSGSLPWEYPKGKGRQGTYEWTIVNPIADYGSAFFGRQRAKSLGFTGGQTLNQQSNIMKNIGMGKGFANLFGVQTGNKQSIGTQTGKSNFFRKIDFGKKISGMI